jgi:hypothetical protein
MVNYRKGHEHLVLCSKSRISHSQDPERGVQTYTSDIPRKEGFRKRIRAYRYSWTVCERNDQCRCQTEVAGTSLVVCHRNIRLMHRQLIPLLNDSLTYITKLGKTQAYNFNWGENGTTGTGTCFPNLTD